MLAKSRTLNVGCLVLPFAVAVIAGCAGPGAAKSRTECPGVKLYNEFHYAEAAAYFRENRVMPHVDYALQSLRLGSSAMAARDWATAKAAFRDATGIIDSFHTNTGLQKWVAMVGDETVKAFKGEPYERAMAHYYLGLLYYADGEYGDATACFRNALFKLKVYDERNNIQADDSAESEFTIAWFLLARCRQRMNDLENAKRCFQLVRENAGPAAAWVTDEALNAKTNILMVLETGQGPYKTPYGPNAVVADLNPIFSSTPLMPEVWLDGKKLREPALLVNMRNIAKKQKWQTLDTIRYVKGFLSSGIAVQQLAASGEVESTMLSIVAKALGPGVNYDMRHWEFMPDNLFVLPLELPPGNHTMKIVFRDTRDSEHPWHAQEYSQVEVPAGKERLIWVRCGPKIEGGRL